MARILIQKHIEVDVTAVKVSQRPLELRDEPDFLKEHDFFVFTINSDRLLEIAKFLSRKDSLSGIQRDHKDERDKEIGKFITSDNPIFPNTIIINIPLEFNNTYYNSKTGQLKFNIKPKSAYVIDGQHRLKAFASDYSKKVNLELVVSAYFDLGLSTMAEIFTRINYFQRPVSKSLVYDLLDINTDPEFVKFVEAHKIVTDLNNTPGSPFYGLVKLLGIAPGLISQAAIVEALTTRYKILSILEAYSKEEKQKIISDYFSVVKSTFNTKWGNEQSLLCRSIGFNALTKLFSMILTKNKKLVDKKKNIDFSVYLSAISRVNVDDDTIRHFGGFKGVNALVEKFRLNLVKKELL